MIWSEIEDLVIRTPDLTKEPNYVLKEVWSFQLFTELRNWLRIILGDKHDIALNSVKFLFHRSSPTLRLLFLDSVILLNSSSHCDHFGIVIFHSVVSRYIEIITWKPPNPPTILAPIAG